MNKLLLGFIIIISFQSFAQNDFRKMNWGDSPEQLKANYPDAKWETESAGGAIIYATNDIIGGLDTKVAYVFFEKKLRSGVYQFQQYHSPGNNLYYEDFMSISSYLDKKYDMEMTENWNDDTWKEYEDKIGFALSMGQVTIEERHEDDRTVIVHSISGDGPGINHTLAYASMDWVKKIRENSLDDF